MVDVGQVRAAPKDALVPSWKLLKGRAVGLEFWGYAAGPWIAAAFRFKNGRAGEKP